MHARHLPLPTRLARDQPDRARQLLAHYGYRPVEGVALLCLRPNLTLTRTPT